MSNIDRNKLFDDGNFFYKDENDNIKQFIESAAFNINSMETYRKLSNHIANCGRVFVGKGNVINNIIIDDSNLAGKGTQITNKVFPDDNSGYHFCIEFALAYNMINKLQSGDDLFLFYFVDDNIDGEMIIVSQFQFIY